MQSDDVLSQIEEHFHVLPLGERSLDFGKILSTETSVKILEAVYNSDNKVGVSTSAISESLGVGRTTALYHLGRMQESGLVELNPVLKTDDSWRKFWELYRTRDADVKTEQFNRLHHARMNGVKLFVPTKKGFLVLPSSDIKESRSVVGEVLATITNLALERDYRKMKKTTSLLGSIGLLLIVFSFLFQLPLFQGIGFGTAPGALYGAQQSFEEVDLQAEAPPPAVTSAPEPPKSDRVEKSASAGYASPESLERAELAAEEDRVSGLQGEGVYASLLSKGLLLVGVLFLGSFLGFLLYSWRRK